MGMEWLENHRREAFIDFHNGAVATDLLSHFDARAYADILEQSGFNRVTLFAKCHHGHAYYPTRIGNPHPSLKLDYLGELGAECARRGIAVAAYQNVVRDVCAARANPDWQQARRDGTVFEPSYYRHVCINSPYVPERLWPMTDELLAAYPFLSGFFFDFTSFLPGACFCKYCQQAMKAGGWDIDDDRQVLLFQQASLREFINTTCARVQAVKPDAAVYFNTPTCVGSMEGQHGQTVWYIESMSASWGYERVPFLGRYFRSKGVRFYNQPGRFHKSWGDFGGIASETAFLYEAGISLSLGAGISVGDQGNPDGTLDPTAYERAAKAMKYYTEREEYVANAHSLPDVAMISPKHLNANLAAASDWSNSGLLNCLIEEKFQFDVVDLDADLRPYAAVVLEDLPLPDESAAHKLRDYVAGGGKLLVLGGAVFSGAGKRLMEEVLGVEYAGRSPYGCHYFRTGEGAICDRLPRSAWATYGPAVYLRPTTARPLVELIYPYTERTDARAVSHAQAHPGPLAPFPAAAIHAYGKGAAGVVCSPLAALYHEHAYPPLRILLKNMLNQLIPPSERRVLFHAPLSAEIFVTRQGSRLVVHMLNFHANRPHVKTLYGETPRPPTVLEEIPPVLDAEVRLLMQLDPERVYLVSSGLAPLERTPLPWVRDGNHIVVRIPRYDIHAMLVVE